MKTFALACIIATQAYAAGGSSDWGYKTNGAEWKDQCETGVNQSPINLKTGLITNDLIAPITRNLYA